MVVKDSNLRAVGAGQGISAPALLSPPCLGSDAMKGRREFSWVKAAGPRQTAERPLLCSGLDHC